MAQTKTANSRQASRTAQRRNQAPNTARISESELGGLKVDELRHQLNERGITGISGLRKPELVKTLVKAIRADKNRPPGGARQTAGARPGASAKATTGGVRTGTRSSKSMKYAEEITSVGQRPQRRGGTLVTTDHDVIRAWAEQRGAVPATVPGTGPKNRPGVLRFDFPGWGGANLKHIDWDQWFATFDERQLNFIYQQERARGGQTNFFRLENPEREDA